MTDEEIYNQMSKSRIRLSHVAKKYGLNIDSFYTARSSGRGLSPLRRAVLLSAIELDEVIKESLNEDKDDEFLEGFLTAAFKLWANEKFKHVDLLLDQLEHRKVSEILRSARSCGLGSEDKFINYIYFHFKKKL